MSFNLPGLIWIEVHEIVFSICPLLVVIVTRVDLVSPLSYIYALSLFPVGLNFLYLFDFRQFFTENRLASNLSDDHFILPIEFFISLHSL